MKNKILFSSESAASRFIQISHCSLILLGLDVDQERIKRSERAEWRGGEGGRKERDPEEDEGRTKEGRETPKESFCSTGW